MNKYQGNKLAEDSIIIKPYNPEWVKMFEQEKQFLHEIVALWLVGTIEHVGSTSVIGLSAKPVIDIMVGVESLSVSEPAIKQLQNNGYCYYPYKADVMHWFCKPSPDIRTHHLHLIPFQSPLWHERIQFRDQLRSHPEIAREYKELKIKLSKKYRNDRELYTQSKGEFVRKVLSMSRS